jgi:hypothetical protein
MKKHIFAFIFVFISFCTCVRAQTILLHEDFNAYMGNASTVPAGWVFTYHSTYSSIGFYGPSGPNAYKFGADQACVASPRFQSADSVKFWLRGASTDNISSLVVLESADSSSWDTVTKVVPIPTLSGQMLAYPLKATSAWVRFLYFKSLGNLAFDDVTIIEDTSQSVPPVMVSAQAISSTQLDVYFSKTLEQTSAETIGNYIADNGIGSPVLATRGTNGSIVHLLFTNAFQDGVNYTLSVSSIKDLGGKTMIPAALSFAYHAPLSNTASPYEVVLNELMTDPLPQVSLPAYEYVELYNRTNKRINLENWEIISGTSFLQSQKLPKVVIEPDSFLVLTTSAAIPYFPSGLPLVALPTLPTMTNAGTTVTLKEPSGIVISTVSYTDNWYHDTSKDEGGWSLEQQDPGNPCAGADNWKASLDARGGTPGTKNSVWELKPDHIPPNAERISIITPLRLKLYFNEPLDSVSAAVIGAYNIDHKLTVVQASPIGPDYKSVYLYLSDSLVPGVIYTLSVNATIKDCMGNNINTTQTVRLARGEKVSAMDVVINEVNYYPRPNSATFVEIYNRSQKVIDLKEMRISSYDTVANQLTSLCYIDTSGYLLFPDDYVVLTKLPDSIKVQYHTSNPNGFIRMVSMPSFSSKSGVVVLSTSTGIIIDRFDYNDKMQFPLLKSHQGVSLERLNPDRPSSDASNWHSAAEDAGFATPAYKNSQYDVSVNDGSEIKVDPEIFSPDNDGHNDVLNIHYLFDAPGYVVNVNIYNARGLLIRNLITNYLAGPEGVFIWDGISDVNAKAGIDIYLVFIQAYLTNGEMKEFKKTCVLGGYVDR